MLSIRPRMCQLHQGIVTHPARPNRSSPCLNSLDSLAVFRMNGQAVGPYRQDESQDPASEYPPALAQPRYRYIDQ